MAFKFLKKLLGKLTKREASRYENFGDLWFEFALTNLWNGTIVEYASIREGAGYREVETVRDAIRDYSSNPEEVCLFTLDRRYTIAQPLKDIRKEGEVFYIDPVYSERNYAICTNGIKIPEKPTLEDFVQKRYGDSSN